MERLRCPGRDGDVGRRLPSPAASLRDPVHGRVADRRGRGVILPPPIAGDASSLPAGPDRRRRLDIRRADPARQHAIGQWTLRVGLLLAVGLLLGFLARKEHDNQKGYRLIVRNFYGVLHVKDTDAATDDEYTERSLLHGTINHGSQILDEPLRYKSTSYYGEDSGVGRAIRAVQKRGPIRVGVVGLGAGVLSNYGRAGDFYRIFEINPLVEKIMGKFSFYPHSPADKRILMGDARLTMERMDSLQLDVLAVDAFSSDAIPVTFDARSAPRLLPPFEARGHPGAAYLNRYLIWSRSAKAAPISSTNPP